MMPGKLSGFAIEKLEERKLLSAALKNAGLASLAYDSAGVLYAAYYDTSSKDLKFATRAFDGTWSSIVTLDPAIGAGAQLSLALDSQGRPGVAYYDSANCDLKYTQFNGSIWSHATIDARGKTGQNPSLVFDSNDHPMISYYSATATDLRLAAFSGRRWSVQTIDAMGSVGRFSSLAIDPVDGSWAIAYESVTNFEIKIALRRKKSFSIGDVAWLSDAANWSCKPSLAFDASDRPNVGYGDRGDGAIKIAIDTRKRWLLTGVDFAYGTDCSLSFDSRNGRSRMVYLDQSGELRLFASSDTGGTYADVGRGSCAAAVQNPVSKALSYFGNQQIVDVFPDLAPVTDLTAGISLDNPEWMSVHWTDNSMDETQFLIQRSTNGANFSTIDIVPANTTDYDDQEVERDTKYYYHVIPCNAAGYEGFASALGEGTSWVANPTDLQAVVIDSGEIDLTWTNASTTATHLEIHCVNDADDHTILDVALDLDPGTTSYHVTQLAEGTPLAAGTSYAFWVSAARSDTYCDSASSTGTTGFATPVDLFIDSVTDDSMHMNWSDVFGEDGYELQWSTDNVNFTTLATLGADVTDYTVNNLTEGTRYYFKVRALSGSGDSAFSQVSNSDTMLATPTNVVATPRAGGQIQLSWDDDSAGEDSYDVEVAGPNGVWTLPTVLAAGTTSYIATQGPYGALEPGLQYRFSIRALVGMGGASARGISPTVTAIA